MSTTEKAPAVAASEVRRQEGEYDNAPAVLGLVRRRLLTPITVAFLVLAGIFATDPELPTWVIFAPLAASVLVFGLPHGALDHLVPTRLAGRRASVTSIGLVAALYVVLGGVVLVIWHISPLIAFAGFIALTWFHWGQGDLWIDLAADEGRRLSGWPLQVGVVAVRGGIPLLLPLVFHPDVYEKVRLGTIEVFAGPAASAGSWSIGADLRVTIAAGFSLVAAAMAVATWRSARTRPQRWAWVHDQSEIVVLSFFFALGPPVLTIGLYFCLWHALRHIVRLELLDPGGAALLRRGQFVGAARRFAIEAAPITAIALVGLALVSFMLPPPTGSPESQLGPYLVLISALTVPHIAIVTFMDRRQGSVISRPMA